MPTTTTTYSFNKPVVGADEDDWGGYLNGNWDSVDDLLDGTTPITGIDINSGTLDGVTIGGTTAGAGTFTTLTASTSITGTLATAAQTNITSVGTLTSLDVGGTVTADGLTVDAATSIFQNSSGSADVVLDRSANSFGATLQYKTGGSLKWYHGLRGLVNDNFYIFNNTASGNSFSIDTNNDISFYEDTGTTAKFFWDASAESLGIGTSSPSTPLHVSKGGNGIATFERSNKTSGSGYLGFNVETNSQATIAFDDGGGLSIGRSSDPSTQAGYSNDFFINSSGNVGIGTSSPARQLQVDSTGNRVISAHHTDGEYCYIVFQDNNTSDDGQVRVGALGNDLLLLAGGSERMRIDSSGNLLVGTTSASTTTVGARLKPSGRGDFTANGGVASIMNRLTNDGDILGLQKDSTVIGLLGNSGNDFYVTGSVSNIAGVTFANSKMMPMKSGSLADGQSDLGSSSYRWRDAYLSGGVYLGGTGSANKLDDLESGNWTPQDSLGNNWSQSTPARYYKIGDLVTCWFDISHNTNIGSRANQLRNFPFTSDSGPNFAGTHGYTTDNNGIVFHLNPNSTDASFYVGSTSEQMTGRLIGAITYRTA